MHKVVGVPACTSVAKVGIAMVGLLTLLAFAICPPHYDDEAHRWTVSRSHIVPVSAIQLPPALPRDPTRTLVTGGLESVPPAWLARLPENVDLAYYPVLDNSTGYVNKGHEAMFYLQYIIDHFDDLPDYMIFVHDHAEAWHNNDVSDKSTLHLLRDLNWTYVASIESGYTNLRCRGNPNCPRIAQLHPSVFGIFPGKMEHFFERAWSEVLEPHFGPLAGREIAAPCCAQFVVSRDAVRQRGERTVDFYEDLRAWIVTQEGSDWSVGRVFEYTWHIIFGAPWVSCPDEKVCRQNLYSFDST